MDILPMKGKTAMRKFLAKNKLETENLELAQECYTMAYNMQVQMIFKTIPIILIRFLTP